MPDNQFAAAAKKRKEQTASPVAAVPDTPAASNERPSRKGAKHVGGYFSPEVSKQLRQIALEEDSSVQKLLAEGIDMLFHSRKLPTIATPKVS